MTIISSTVGDSGGGSGAPSHPAMDASVVSTCRVIGWWPTPPPPIIGAGPQHHLLSLVQHNKVRHGVGVVKQNEVIAQRKIVER